jgi:hypothetical protein
MLNGRNDLAVLWDVRVHPEYRGRGVGHRLFTAAAEWARTRDCRVLKIETQNINAPACRSTPDRAANSGRYAATPTPIFLRKLSCSGTSGCKEDRYDRRPCGDSQSQRIGLGRSRGDLRGRHARLGFRPRGRQQPAPSERRLLGDLRPWCRRAIHLQCSGGWDAVSLVEQGAHEVVGIDISPRMIAMARRRAQALGLNASFYVSDVLDTPHELDGSADLVYTGKGALPWIMDMEAWARVVARLLAPGGLLYVFEGHPLDGVWDVDGPSTASTLPTATTSTTA